MKSLIALVFGLLASSIVQAHPEHSAPPMPKDFDHLKSLVGTWKGTVMMNGKEQPVTTTYELTSGGTAIMEKLMPGTPHEMVSIYHADGKNLAMTHYCSMGNHPTMRLQSADDKKMHFEMTKADGVSSMKEPHMHGITLSFVDPDTLKEDWAEMEDGAKGSDTTFTFKRQK